MVKIEFVADHTIDQGTVEPSGPKSIGIVNYELILVARPGPLLLASMGPLHRHWPQRTNLLLHINVISFSSNS